MLVNNRSILFTNRPRTPSSSHLHIARLAFYPASVLIGEAIISSVGQSMILAAAPPLIHLIVLATMSALLLMPIFAAIKFLIDKNLSESSYSRRASYTLLYLVDIFLNLKLMAYLAVNLHRPIMNMYTLYTIVGAGIFPVVALSIVVAFAIQSYISHHRNRNVLDSQNLEIDMDTSIAGPGRSSSR